MAEVRALELSTAFLSPETIEHAMTTDLPVWAHANGYGFMIYVPDDETIASWREKYGPWIGNLIDCLLYARGLGFEYIMFDCDGDNNETIPLNTYW